MRPSSKLHSVCQSGKPDWEGACSFSLSSPPSLSRNKLGKYCPPNNCTLGSFHGWGSGAWGRGGRSDSSGIQIVHWEMTFLRKTQELEARSWEREALFLTSLSGSFCSWAQETWEASRCGRRSWVWRTCFPRQGSHSIYCASSPSPYSSPCIYSMGEKQITGTDLTQWFLSSLWEAKWGDMNCWCLIIPSFLLSPPLKREICPLKRVSIITHSIWIRYLLYIKKWATDGAWKLRSQQLLWVYSALKANNFYISTWTHTK